MRNAARAVLTALGVAGGAVALYGGSRAAYRRHVKASCADFYAEARREFLQPGLSQGFVPQDIAWSDELGCWLFSGYVGTGAGKQGFANSEPSPVYMHIVRAQDLGAQSLSWERLLVRDPDGKPYNGHGAAIATAGKWAYLSCDDGVLVLPAERLVRATEGEAVDAVAHVPLGLEPAFMGVYEGALYVGEYAGPGFRTPASHHLACPDGTRNPALMLRYPLDTQAPWGLAGQPDQVFSIPAQVQGFCFGTRNDLVVSCSWGFGDAHLASYDRARLKPCSTLAWQGRDLPVTFLDRASERRRLTVPPMAEGIELHAGRVWLANESCAGRYKVGRVFDGRWVWSLDF